MKATNGSTSRLHEMLVFMWDKNNYMHFPSTTFNFSCQRINIMFAKDDIYTLADIVIVDPMWGNLFPRSCATQGFVTSNANQAKEKSYHNQHSTNQLLPLAIEVFGCLHKHADVFLHDCVNPICSLKGTKGLHLSTLIIFFHKKFSITIFHLKSVPFLTLHLNHNNQA
jgi:hypothetical protein